MSAGAELEQYIFQTHNSNKFWIFNGGIWTAYPRPWVRRWRVCPSAEVNQPGHVVLSFLMVSPLSTTWRFDNCKCSVANDTYDDCTVQLRPTCTLAASVRANQVILTLIDQCSRPRYLLHETIHNTSLLVIVFCSLNLTSRSHFSLLFNSPSLPRPPHSFPSLYPLLFPSHLGDLVQRNCRL